LAKDWKWLESTKKLQEEVYGYDYGYLNRLHESAVTFEQHKSALTIYLDWNTTAAVQELAEVREEFSWKPWATDIAFVHRNRVIQEAVDVLHFLGNILTAVGCTDEMLEEVYRRKQQINTERAASGTYSARKGGLAEGSD
jgi:hypothetical protein